MPEGWQVGMFIHIVAVFALGGATAISLVTFTMMRGSKTVQEVRFWGGLGRLLSQYQVFPVTALVLVLSGAYLVDELHEEWSDGWIGFSAVAVVLAVVVGLLVITPRMKTIGMTAGPAPDGPLPDVVSRKIHDPILAGASRANALTTLAIIWNMTVQPDNVAALLSILVAAAVGMASALPDYQRQQHHEP